MYSPGTAVRRLPTTSPICPILIVLILSLEWFRTRTEAKVVIEQLAMPLQWHQTALEPGIPHARRVQAAVLFN
jgi:hypothetical protein